MLRFIIKTRCRGSAFFYVLHISIAIGACFFTSSGADAARRELNGDVFSSPETLVELHRSENIIMGELSKYMRKNNVEHEYLER